MTATAGRPYVVGISGDITRDERLQLEAAGFRWKGSYDVLREGWEREIDTTPWTTRHVVQVAAQDADAAVQQVTATLGRSDLAAEVAAR